MSFICDRCGHRKWGYPLGAAINRSVCHDCFFGDTLGLPQPAHVWARLAAVARGDEDREKGTDDDTWRLVEQRESSWTYRVR